MFVSLGSCSACPFNVAASWKSSRYMPHAKCTLPTLKGGVAQESFLNAKACLNSFVEGGSRKHAWDNTFPFPFWFKVVPACPREKKRIGLQMSLVCVLRWHKQTTRDSVDMFSSGSSSWCLALHRADQYMDLSSRPYWWNVGGAPLWVPQTYICFASKNRILLGRIRILPMF